MREKVPPKAGWYILFGDKRMKPLKTKVSVTLDTPVLDQTRLLAEEEDRSLSSYINLVLKAHLERKAGEK